MAFEVPTWVDYLGYGDNTDNYFIHYAHLPSSVPLRPLQYGWHRTLSAYGYGPTVRDHYLIHFITEGCGRVVVGDRQYPVCAGQCFAIYPHQITYYEADTEQPWSYYWLGFEGDWCADLMAMAGFSDEQIVIHIPHAAQVFSSLAALAQEMRTPSFYLSLTGRLHNVLYILGQGTNVQPVHYDIVEGPLGNEYVRILLSIIKTSFSERINIQALADRLGLNRSYMTELFRRHTGHSIQSYLHEYRLQWSLILLQNARASVKSVALESGFQDPLYFSRTFRARFGLSPQQYRASESWKDGGPSEQA